MISILKQDNLKQGTLLVTLNTRPLQINAGACVGEGHIVSITRIQVVVSQPSRTRLYAALTQRTSVEIRIIEVEADVIVGENWWCTGSRGGANSKGSGLLDVPFLGAAGLRLALEVGEG